MQNTMLDRGYVCPRTRACLRLDGARLRDDEARTNYVVKNGIPQFLASQPTEGDSTEAVLERLNALTRSEGWRAALKEVYADVPGMVRYVTETRRSAFLDLVPLGKDDDVLEIGPGLGQMTVRLARRARSVSAIEVVPGQAEFVALRCEQESVDNVRVAVGGDDCRLPYADASFDLVVLNLVLEWCASRCTEEAPIDVQRRMLREVQRVLRPGGTFYLATKNRYALTYLTGRRDSHTHGQRFGSALPRWLSSALQRLRGLPRAPGLLHSHGALERMLVNAGFDQIRSYWAVPEMRYPAEYVPTDAASVRAARSRPGFVQGESRRTRMLMRVIPAPWVKLVTPGLAFVARKNG